MASSHSLWTRSSTWLTQQRHGFGRRGAILLLLCCGCLLSLIATPVAEATNGWIWESVGELGPGSPNGTVYALAVDPCGNVYAGGTFQKPSAPTGKIDADRVAMFNRRQGRWYEMPGITTGMVKAIAPFNNCAGAYVGGSFTLGTITGMATNVAGWHWSNINAGTGQWVAVGNASVGTGTDRSVYAMAVGRNGHLYVGGDFERAGTAAANSIATWNGSNWSQVGNGLDGWVEALAVRDDGSVYAGGGFAGPQNNGAGYIAQWNGGNWERVGQGGMNNRVYALAVYRGKNLHSAADDALYAGGIFTEADVGVSANRIARWSDGAWSALDTGINDQVAALAVDGCGTLYAGGYRFTRAGTARVTMLARWSQVYDPATDSTRWEWSAPGSGTNDNVLALAISNDPSSQLDLPYIYIGGAFSGVDGVAAAHIARAENPRPAFWINDVTAAEGYRGADYMLYLSAPVDAQTSVHYKTQDGTDAPGDVAAKGALAGSNNPVRADYNIWDDVATLAPCTPGHESLRSLPVGFRRCNDYDHAVDAGEEKFRIKLDQPTNAVIKTPQAIATIVNVPEPGCE